MAREFVATISSGRGAWKEFVSHEAGTRQLRNILVHDVKLAWIVSRDGASWIPKSSELKKYRTWEQVFDAGDDPNLVRSHFEPCNERAGNDLANLSRILNDLWERILSSFDDEFYGPRSNLRALYDIEFADVDTENPANDCEGPLPSSQPNITTSGGRIVDLGSRDSQRPSLNPEASQ